MRVLLVHDYGDDTGGAERIVRTTKAVLEENGHAVLLYAPLRHDGFIRSIFSIHHYLGVQKEIRRFKPDIVHVHSVFRNVSPSVLLTAGRMKTPVVMTLHDFQIVCPKTSLVDESRANCESGFGCRCFYRSCYPRKPFNRAYQGLKALRLALHRAVIRRTVRQFLSPSVCLMNWTKKNFGVENISLLPNFISSETQASKNIPKRGTLLFVGKLTEQKGVDVLIKAVAKVRAVIPDVRLKIVGGGPDEKKFKELTEHLRLADVVTYTGKLPYPQVMREYEDAFCVVIPSKYVENCSIVGIEALSMGRVVIASDIGGLPDLVDDTETGFLVQPGDVDDLSRKIVFAFQNESRLPSMGARAREKYERCFSRQAYYEALFSVYDRTIRKTRDRNV